MRHAVILAGGAGVRLWPMSRETLPKQLLPFIDGKSLLELSFGRLENLVEPENRLICTGRKHLGAILERMPDLTPAQLLGEPAGRDTLVALAASCAVIAKKDPGAVVTVLTADHLIEPVDRFRAIIGRGFEFIESNPRYLGTFGITPDYPATGFGYLELGSPLTPDADGPRQVDRFIEKPDLPTAGRYLAEGSSRYLWNSGMFVWKAATFLSFVKSYHPRVHEGVSAIAAARGTPGFEAVLERIYPELLKISVDYAVMEPASREQAVVTIPMELEWHDIGSWTAYADVCRKDGAGNAVSAPRAVLLESMDNLLVSDEPEHLLCTLGCSDLIVVHTKDATLICRRDRAQDLKKVHAEVASRFGDRYL